MTSPDQKNPRSTQSAVIRRAVALVLVGAASARAAQLPIPCAAGACGGATAPAGWSTTADGRTVSPGNSYAQSGNRLDVTQTQNSAYLNWKSFNISSDAIVNFKQPSSTAVALNRIFDATLSQINGTLKANGQVYLLNQNGFLFGPNAVVNVGGLVASSLNISPDAIQNGIASAIQAPTKGPAFQPYVDEKGNALPSGPVTVQAGAQITSEDGQVLLFAPNVDNEGSIQTPSGQTILGAGKRVFLAVASDGITRGLVIEVGDGGAVTNGSTGQIVSTTGNVTLAGLAVNQSGRVSATTTVRSNGSIRLQARDTSATNAASVAGVVQGLPDRSGMLVLGSASQTSVSLEGSSSDTTVDVNAQPKSNIELDGGTIELQDHASLVAPSGRVSLNALGDSLLGNIAAKQLGAVGVAPDQSRIYLAPTSTIDVSGANVSLPMESSSLSVQLRGSQLADFPQQRNGALRGQTVNVDLRQYGTRADGSPWIGTPLGDLSGDVSAIQRDVFERNLTGGTINLNASGSVIMGQGATLNVSGGRIDYQSGYVKSSVLLGTDGKAYPIASADPSRTYVGTVDAISQDDPHWGTKSTVVLPLSSSRGLYEAGYTEGKDAGSVSVIAPAAIVDGTIDGGAAIGIHQRLPSTTFWSTSQLYRPYDQMPVAGTLTLGNSAGITDTTNASREVLQSVTFAPVTMLDTLVGANGKTFDPLTDPLPQSFVTSLRPSLLGASGVTHLNVYAEDAIAVPQGIALAPGAGGSISLNAGRVALAGALDTPGGSVTLKAAPTVAHPADVGFVGADPNGGLPSLSLEAASSIDVSGEWVNDDPVSSGGRLLPLFTSGGQVSISSLRGALRASEGAVIDVSGGAQRTASGALVGGVGGSISISASPATIQQAFHPAIEMEASLRGFALNNGGALTLALPQLCLSAAPCEEAGLLQIAPALFTNFGFGSVALKATLGSLTVASDVDLAAAQRNLLFLPGAFSRPSARSLAPLTQAALLPQNFRKPESLSLSSSSGGLLETGRALPYALTIADGARVALDPLGSISLTADTRIFQNGTLIAAGGRVNVLLSPLGSVNTSGPAYFADQAIWLGPSSLIDVSGVLQATPNDFNLDLGSVLPGGNISVLAKGGYLFAPQGAALVAAGTTGPLDLRSAGSTSYGRAQVGSQGGTISLAAAEGMQFDGRLAAPSGTGSNAAAGTLSVTLNGLLVGSRDQINGFLSVPDNLTVLAAPSPIVIGEGTAVPASLNGSARIGASTINAGGFDNVTLSVRNLGESVAGANVGTVTFDSGVSLSPAASLVIDAPQIRAGGGGGGVTLQSAYVALGSSDTQSQSVNTAPLAGAADLQVTGRLVDLVGSFDISGFKTPSIVSTGDLRAAGVQDLAHGPGYLGGLTVSGALDLSAQQIYPTTLSNYSIEIIPGVSGPSLLTLTRAPGQAGAVLSAAGRLALQAGSIADSGVVRAPLGSISMSGETVTLSSGAVVSVSAGGLTIPFGQTQAGLDWVYQLAPGTNGVITVYGIGAGDVLLPQKRVSLTAGTVDIEPGAKIDLSGGGDLSAYEYTPGLGGNTDVLLPKSQRTGTFAPDVFAIVPTLKVPYAPLDPHEDLGFAQALAGIGFTQPVGASVHLSGADGLPSGTYALLPARYGLLPGAYLVRPASGYADLAPGQTVAQLDGSVIVSGYRTNAATGHGDTRSSGFDITRGSYALQEAQYNLTSANAFFGAQTTATHVSTLRLPADAGNLAISADTSATLLGQLLTAAQTGARGATVDLSSQKLIITNDAQGKPAGFVALDPDQLNSLGAESILIGGTRTPTADATVINGISSDVIVDKGVTLAGQEWIFAATGALSIGPDASVLATGVPVAKQAPIQVPAGTAVVRASTGPQTDLTSPVAPGGTGAGPGSGGGALSGGGQISVAAGAVVGGTGSVSFDAGGAVTFAGNLSAAGAAIRLGADQIALGAVPDTFKGFAIGDSLFAGIANSDLQLSSPNPLQVFGPVDLTLAKLLITAPGLDVTANSASLTVNSGDLTLKSPSSQAFSGAAAGSGAVQLSATHVTLAGGTFTVAGATDTVLNASQDLTATADGTLGVGGNLRLASGIVQSAAGVDYHLTSAGDLTTAQHGAALTATSRSGPGGAFNFTGDSVTLGGNILLPGGLVAADALLTNVNVSADAVINVAGFGVDFDGETRSAPGGAINLTSASGDILVAPTALLDISAGTGTASGGSLSLTAPLGLVTLGGALHAAGGVGQSGGDLTIDAARFDFPSLVALGSSAGLTGRWDLRERGRPGDGLTSDIVLSPGSTLRATDVSVSTDQGAIEIFGTIDASSPLGGQITLASQYGLEVGGTLLAGSTAHADRGGTIQLDSNTGLLFVDSGAVLSVGGTGFTPTGTIWMRAPQQSVLSVASETAAHDVRLDGKVVGAANIYLEGFKSYESTTVDASTVAADPGNPLYADAAAFTQTVAQNQTAFSTALGSNVTVLPGVEIDARGDLHVASAWDLSAWRFGPDAGTPGGGIPGVLTLRATGNLYVDQSISDGVTLVTGPFVSLPLLGATQGPSWSYRLAAGASLDSANPLAVLSRPELSGTADNGNFVLAAGVPIPNDPATQGTGAPMVIATGTGFINVTAAGDVRLANQASTIYTVGVAGTKDLVIDDTLNGNSNFQNLPYATGGGSISVTAGRDVLGAPSDQLFTDWLWRTGNTGAAGARFQAPSWTPSITFFNQGVGALGGGDLTVRAGRNVVDLGANVPSVGRPVGDNTPSGTTTQELNDGVLRIIAGADISGGKFLDMAGPAFIRAAGGLNQGTSPLTGGTRGLYPVLALSSGQLDAMARRGVAIETILNPTLLPESSFQSPVAQPFFSTYSDSSGVSLTSVGADVDLINQAAGKNSILQTSAAHVGFESNADSVDLRMFAPSLSAVSLGGDVNVSGSMDLWPSAHGNLDLLAAGSVVLAGVNGSTPHILMLDADPRLLPAVGHLIVSNASGYLPLAIALANVDNITGSDDPSTGNVASHASSPVHGGLFSADGLADLVPARIVAESGDIRVDTTSGSLISIPKQLEMFAGQDISNLTLTTQQFAGGNVSSVFAGRDIIYPSARLGNGALAPNLGGLFFDGPGRDSVAAGRNVNLGTSSGIVSEGNLRNPALAVGGAALSVAAGVPGNPDYSGFTGTYLAAADDYDQLLVSYVEGIAGGSHLSKSQALAAFALLPTSQQTPLIEAVLFDELRAGGRSAAANGPTHNNFTRAFNALTTLFPGSNPDLATGEKNPYVGDLLLYFSRIDTLQGGDVNLLAPGGQINVGLATAPTAFGVTKSPSQLGIVAQDVGSISMVAYSDIQVNQSRVFAADGGNILMWSTEGNIDAGRGAKTAISAPPPTVTIDPKTGAVTVNFPQALTGSGIQALTTTPGVLAGDVDLFAPHGVVNANDAGIVAGNLTVAATAVLGANNITVSGTSVGVPVTVTGLGANLASASTAGSAATSSGESSLGESDRKEKAPLASTALGWLDVFVLGLGEEQCKTDDLECIKRQKTQ